MHSPYLRWSFALASTALFALVLWSAQPIFAESGSGSTPIVGSWMGTATATNPPLGSMANLITFTPKGGVIESRRLYVPDSPIGPLLETSGHGEWVKTGGHEYQVHFVFLLQGAPDHPTLRGVPLGTDNVSLHLHLNHAGAELQGTFESNIKDLDGTVVFTTTGTYSATLIHVAP